MHAMLAALLISAATCFGAPRPDLPAIEAIAAAPAAAGFAAEVPAFEAARADLLEAGDASASQGRELLLRVHDLAGRGHAPHSYGEARCFLFGKADNVLQGRERGVVDAYSGVFVAGTSCEGRDYREQGDQNGDAYVDRDGMNAEHVWPQSFFRKQAPMKSDLHHLLPTFIHPNSVRGSLPFGEVQGRATYENSGGARATQSLFEPPDQVKGRVARSMLYFYARYLDREITDGGFSHDFWNARIAQFLRWNRRFPPDDAERQRNDLVQGFQGNRNPFVDDPGLADRIGPEAFLLGARGLYAASSGPGQR